MRLKSTIFAALFSLFAASSAQATVLTFDKLVTQYGDGPSLGQNMSLSGKSLSYTESGYVFTLFGPNATSGARVHIGDVGSVSTYNWHDEADNGAGAYVVLTAANGKAFDLLAFDYASTSGNGLTVSASGYAGQTLSNQAHYATPLLNVTSVTFSSTGYNYNQLDNVNVRAAVPEPTSLSLVGLGLLGAVLVRRKGVRKAVRK